MDDLTEYSSKVVGFRSTSQADRQTNLADTSTGTDTLPVKKDQSAETNRKCNAETQTGLFSGENLQVDEKKLSAWLKRIYPAVESELLKGPTPMLEDNRYCNANDDEEFVIQTYQKIALASDENSLGLATWLSTHTNNAPVLVLTTSAPHDKWCEHVNQTLKVYVPQRMAAGNFIVFTEMKSIAVKSCMSSLTTNTFNKDIFCGSTISGDIYVWQYEATGNGSITVKELFCETSRHGCAVAMDWSDENRLLTCHSSGWVVQWLIGKHIIKEGEFLVKYKNNIPQELTTIVSVSITDFVVGAKDGKVFHCSILNMGAIKTKFDIRALNSHPFDVTSLFKAKFPGRLIVISCDLSGQIYYHDLQTYNDDDGSELIIQIPLPFKNAIACSIDGSVIFCPGNDGSLDIYRVKNGLYSSIKGALQGKGHMIKCSGNGCWFVTGLYGDEFQIFKLGE